MNCECCGRKLRADEGKVCRFCEGRTHQIRKQMEKKQLHQTERSVR